MNILTVLKNDCTGCSACSNICPKKAISMQKDKFGFDGPLVNNELCNDCGLCYKKCPLNSYEKNESHKAVYALSHKSVAARKKSSSGGAFLWLATHFIESGGAVYGAAFDKLGKVCHCRVTSKEELKKLQGSKYVQSSINDIYLQVKKDISERKVLFSGTPCQVAGLYAVTGKHENLFTCDLLCFGAPSPLVFDIYKEETVGAGELKEVNFRDKTFGWHRYSMRIKTGSEDYISDKISDEFLLGFQTKLFIRASCYQCKFRSIDRVGDITLGDFWSFKENFKKNCLKDNDTGVSFVMLNNKKAKQLFSEIEKESVYYEKRELEDNIDNWGFGKEMEYPQKRDAFFEDLAANGYGKAIASHIRKKNYNKQTSLLRRLYRKMKKYYWFRYFLNKIHK